ncbi:MAG: NAD-binding protein, partial [Candidatus Omnitrophota bacterium]|nr:NAD-binding protein [Candidatus Omnitrophota bacterium]
GVEKADIFCALTNSDNINIMASQVAKGLFKIPRVIARVYDPRKAAIYRTLGLDVLSETSLFASMIRDKITDKLLSSFLIETNELGILEFPVPEDSIGKTVSAFNVPGESIIATVRLGGKSPIIPEATTKLRKGDVLVAVVKVGHIDKIKRMFNL